MLRIGISFDKRLAAEDILETLIDLVVRRLPGFGGYHPSGYTNRTPMRRVGVNNINAGSEVLNPPAPYKRKILGAQSSGRG